MQFVKDNRMTIIATTLFFISSYNAVIYYYNKEQKPFKIAYDPLEEYISNRNKRYDILIANSEQKKIANSEQKKIPNQEIEIKINKSNILFESTPLGNIIMSYDQEKNEFEYYANRSFPYSILDRSSHAAPDCPDKIDNDKKSRHSLGREDKHTAHVSKKQRVSKFSRNTTEHRHHRSSDEQAVSSSSE